MFDGEAFGRQIVESVKGHISRELGPLIQRLAALEARAPEKGEPGRDGLNGESVDMELVGRMVADAVAALPPPRDGQDGAQGPPGTDGLNGKDGAPGATGEPGKEGPPGRDGRDGLPGVPGQSGEKGIDGLNGRDGRDGIDGLGFDDLSVDFDDERTMKLRFVNGERVKEWPLTFPVLLDRGVYKSDVEYFRGDSVSYDGSIFIAQRTTRAENPKTSDDWRLSVKRGRDGKDGRDGERGFQGKEGPPGRDLTQLGPDGHKW